MEAIQSSTCVGDVVYPPFRLSNHHMAVHEDAWDVLVHAGKDRSALIM